jgi:hypothetical protein
MGGNPSAQVPSPNRLFVDPSARHQVTLPPHPLAPTPPIMCGLPQGYVPFTFIIIGYIVICKYRQWQTHTRNS